MAENYYTLLGIATNATDAEIKAAYRKAAMKYHPDRNPGNKEAEAQFRKINGAYEALSDPHKRKLYDQYGEAGVDQNASGGFGGGFGRGQHRSAEEDLGDFFSQFVSGMGGGDEDENADLGYSIELTLAEAFEGGEREITGTRRELCEKCDGRGAKSGGYKDCPDCEGAGQVRQRMLGMVMMRTCRRCSGSGQVIANPCAGCHGQGNVERKFKQTFRIPPGIYHGAKMRLEGVGHHFNKRYRPGSIYIVVSVKRDPRFERKDDDLSIAAHIDIVTASLGGTAVVPTIEGEPVTVKIVPGTQVDSTLRVREKGMPKLHGRGRGDMLVHVRIDVPRELTKKQKDLLEQLRASFQDEHDGKKGDGGVFGKIFGQ